MNALEQALITSNFDVNEPRSWANVSVHTPPEFDIAKFQKQINKILGLTENGLPVCRLVWAADIKKTYIKKYCKWEGLLGVETELHAKYRFARIKIPNTTDTYIDIPPPRWIIEEHNSYGQGAASSEKARWDKFGKELIPPPALEGYYSELFTIAEHTETCCNDKLVCWGTYRLPSQKDLNRLQRAKNLRDKDMFIDPTRPLSPDTLALIGRDTENKIQHHQELKDAQLAEFVDEHAAELIEKFTGQKTKTAAFMLPKKEKGLIALK